MSASATQGGHNQCCAVG